MIEDTAEEVVQEPKSAASDAAPSRSGNMQFAIQIGGMVLLIGAVIVGYARWKTGSMDLVWPWLQGQRLLVDPIQIELGVLSKGEVVHREVRVVNVSSDALNLLGSQTSCGCITLDDFPMVISPGEDSSLRLKIGMPPIAGSFEQTVKLFSDDKGYSAVLIVVSADVR